MDKSTQKISTELVLRLEDNDLSKEQEAELFALLRCEKNRRYVIQHLDFAAWVRTCLHTEGLKKDNCRV
jgi:hypothetical protein